MKLAIIRTGGKQYKVAEGDVITVEHIASDDKNITFSDVLLYAADSDVQIGAPVLTGVTVTGTLLGDVKGDKISVSKFKAKARYRRVTGHRQALSQVKIESIGSSGKKSAKQESQPKADQSLAEKETKVTSKTAAKKQ